MEMTRAPRQHGGPRRTRPSDVEQDKRGRMVLQKANQRKLADEAYASIVSVFFERLLDPLKKRIALRVESNLHYFSVSIAALFVKAAVPVRSMKIGIAHLGVVRSFTQNTQQTKNIPFAGSLPARSAQAPSAMSLSPRPSSKTIKSQGMAPQTITLDGYAASHRAVRETMIDGSISPTCTSKISTRLLFG